MTLKFGDGKNNGKSEQVSQLQKVLATLGFSSGTIDGEYGNNTAAAVAKFQTTYNLNPTGALDEVTFNKMQSVVTGGSALVKPASVQPITSLVTTPPSILNLPIFGVKTSYWLLGLGVIAIVAYTLRKPKENVYDDDMENI